MDDFDFYMHELVVKYLRAKYPDIRVNYASFAAHFSVMGKGRRQKYINRFTNLSRKEFEESVKNEIEKEIDLIMKERFLNLKREK